MRKIMEEIKELLGVFNLFLTFKEFKAEPYIINSEDSITILQYWKVYKIYKHMKLKDFEKCVVGYSVTANLPIYTTCEEIAKKLKLD